MTEQLPDPPIPSECDLRGFPFTPLFRARLFGSAFHALSTDREWRAGVTLWLKSWDQVPAGSLPDNDVELCRLAELGRDVKVWAKVRAGAMRGWFACNDGRLYHETVAEGILEAWSRHSAARRRGIAGAEKRYGRSIAQPQTDHRATTDDPQTLYSNRQGQRQGEGEGQKKDGAPGSDVLRSISVLEGGRS